MNYQTQWNKITQPQQGKSLVLAYEINLLHHFPLGYRLKFYNFLQAQTIRTGQIDFNLFPIPYIA